MCQYGGRCAGTNCTCKFGAQLSTPRGDASHQHSPPNPVFKLMGRSMPAHYTPRIFKPGWCWDFIMFFTLLTFQVTYHVCCIAHFILSWTMYLGILPFRGFKVKKKRFRRKRLPYHLVLRCRRRSGNRPPHLSSPYFSSEERSTASGDDEPPQHEWDWWGSMRMWRHLWTRPVERGKTRAEPRSQPKFYEPPWEVPEGAIEEFCSKGDFISLPRLLKTLVQEVNHEVNVK